jgi:AraC-like DNA-binding protein
VTVCAKDKEPGVTLDFRTAHASATVKIDLVRCRPHDHGCGPVEYGLGDQIVLPLRGVFVRHLGPRNRVVADPCNALFFRDAEPYRVSHPAHAGDECLVIEPARDVLVDALGERPLERTHTVLDARAIAARRWLCHRMDRGLATPLEIEETALELVASTLSAVGQPRAVPRSARRRSRHEEMVEATKIALAARPAENWSLSALAERVASSPFRLARLFREIAGTPVHRYHLNARLSAALDELLASTCEITEIGIGLGFSSHSHFTATFRRAFGVTPSALRRGVPPAAQLGKISTAP